MTTPTGWSNRPLGPPSETTKLDRRPRLRFKNLDHEKRDVILDAAAEVFSAHGYDDAPYNQIIARAGVSKGAIYYYFDDKADLYATVVCAHGGFVTGPRRPAATTGPSSHLGRATAPRKQFHDGEEKPPL